MTRGGVELSDAPLISIRICTRSVASRLAVARRTEMTFDCGRWRAIATRWGRWRPDSASAVGVGVDQSR